MTPSQSRILSLCTNLQPSGKAGTWLCSCPLLDRHQHGDRNRSATVRLLNGGDLHIHCFVCRQEMGRLEYFTAVCWSFQVKPLDWSGTEQKPSSYPGSRSGGWQEHDLSKRTIERTYNYHDATGRLLYQCVRYGDGLQPKFHYRRPAREVEPTSVRVTTDRDGRWVWDANCGEWQNGMGEIVPADKHECLYRLPDVLGKPAATVLICEGEKDADTLSGLGLVSTCNPHGAGNFKHHLAADLSGRRCVVFEDNDEPGRRHVQSVAGCLVMAGAASVRIVTFHELEPKADVTDWILSMPAGWNQNQIRQAVVDRCRLAPEWVNTGLKRAA